MGKSNERCEPVFFRQSDYDANCESRSDTALTTYDVCMAVSKIVGKSLVDGAQNIRGVWRIYLSDRPARLNLCVKKEFQCQCLTKTRALQSSYHQTKSERR